MGVLTILRDDFKMKNLISLQGIKNCLIIFRCEDEALSDILNDLSRLGIGATYGIIDVLDLALSFPEESVIKTNRPEFERRISVTEIQNSINKQMSSSFNYILFIILAAITAGCGLILNNATVLIASMIISPLMAPILSMAFGTIIRDKVMFKRGVLFQIYGFFIAFVIGWILGIVSDELGYGTKPTFEMLLRNYPDILSFIIALAAGIAAGFSLTNVLESSVVGIAIATSITSPTVNAGIALAYNEPQLAIGSLMLFFMNIVVINFSTLIVFKIKKVRQFAKPKMEWEKIEPV